MKKILLVSLIIVSLTGCTRNLERTVTLYDANGKVIKSWETSKSVKYAGPTAGFIDKNGLNVRISGTFVIEGK